MKGDGFNWNLNFPPPVIESHSEAKLRLLRHYLDSYFDTVASDPRLDRLQISFVDGFCGGGAFLDSSGKILGGTPIVMLDAVQHASARLNLKRRKQLIVDARFYFVDENFAALEFLKNEIKQRGLSHQIGTSIQLINGRFEDHYSAITADILEKASAGRSIFLLDQFGYSQVPLAICRDLLQTLRRSELILTFAIDWLVDYMSANPAFVKAVGPVELSEQHIVNYLKTKGLKEHRYIVQRALGRHIKDVTGAAFFTPFFIRSEKSGRDLWVIHLSKHPTARNVMTESHWSIQNGSLHQGEAGLDMLGFDPKLDEAPLLDFDFDESAASKIEEKLCEQIPDRVSELDAFGPITFDAFVAAVANGTAARLDQIEKALIFLHKEKEIELLTLTGKPKQFDAKLVSTDRLTISRQPMLPGFYIKKK